MRHLRRALWLMERFFVQKREIRWRGVVGIMGNMRKSFEDNGAFFFGGVLILERFGQTIIGGTTRKCVLRTLRIWLKKRYEWFLVENCVSCRSNFMRP